jgi:hypothetical protein
MLRHPSFLGERLYKPAEVVLDRAFSPDVKTTHRKKARKL